MRYFKRVLSTMLITATFLTAVPVLAGTEAQAAAPPGRTVYFNETYDEFFPTGYGYIELPRDIGNWNLPAPYDKYENVTSGSRVYLGAGGMTSGMQIVYQNTKPTCVKRKLTDNLAIHDNNITHYVYEWNMRIEDVSDIWRVRPFVEVTPNTNGQITGTTSAYARIGMQTKKIAVEVNKTAKTYDLYVNQQRVKTNVSFPQAESDYSLFFENGFHERATKYSNMIIDNLTAYSGTYDEGVKFPIEPSGVWWVNNEFTSARFNYGSYTPFDFSSIPVTGHLGMKPPYQNYYIQRETASSGTISHTASILGKEALTLTSASYGNVTFYRFIDDNIGAGNINENGIFTYEVRVNTSGTSAWNLGFLTDTGWVTQDLYTVGSTGNTWKDIAIQVDTSRGHYNTYYKVFVNGVCVKDTYFGNIGAFNAFMIRSSGGGTGAININKIIAYPGVCANRLDEYCSLSY